MSWPSVTLRRRTGSLVTMALVAVAAAAACGSSAQLSEPVSPGVPAPTTIADATPTPRAPAPSSGTAGATSPSRPRTAAPAPPRRVVPSDGKPREARLSIPALDIENLQVKPHRGRPDDAAGTRIQDQGIAASPYGSAGGVGPGGLGNHIVTAHRLSSTQAFLDLPELDDGAEVHVEAGGRRYTYRILATRITSFRSPESLAAQAAPVPGRPGLAPIKAMITLSTCRTPEDRAEGNDWSDQFGNPEHRIDKIGELVSVRSV